MKITIENRIGIIEGSKLPRKTKKHLLGTRIKKSVLKKMLDSVTLGEPIKTMYERREIFPKEFCPKCGCEGYQGGGNMASYPEHWEYFNCVKCKNVVGYIDNSPFIHALECKDNNWNPVF